MKSLMKEGKKTVLNCSVSDVIHSSVSDIHV